MSRSFLIFSLCVLLLSGLAAQEKDIPALYKNPSAPIEDRVADLLSRLTLEEKIDMLGGVEGFYIRPNERLGIPKIKMSDGPLGVRNYGEATAFPAGIALAASWNPGLMSKVGESDFSFYSAHKNRWLVEPGEFEVMVGSSSADLKLRTHFTLQ